MCENAIMTVAEFGLLLVECLQFLKPVTGVHLASVAATESTLLWHDLPDVSSPVPGHTAFLVL